MARSAVASLKITQSQRHVHIATDVRVNTQGNDRPLPRLFAGPHVHHRTIGFSLDVPATAHSHDASSAAGVLARGAARRITDGIADRHSGLGIEQRVDRHWIGVQRILTVERLHEEHRDVVWIIDIPIMEEAFHRPFDQAAIAGEGGRKERGGGP